MPPDSSSYSVRSVAAHSVLSAASDVDALSMGAVVSFADCRAEVSPDDELFEHPAVTARARTAIKIFLVHIFTLL